MAFISCSQARACLARRRLIPQSYSGVRLMATEEQQNRSDASTNELWMRALEPKPPAFVRMPQAEKAKAKKLATVYTKLMWKREYVLKKDLNRKLMLKWAALHALPTDELRREALVIDPWIPTLKIPRQTPPLAGFQGPEALAEEEIASRKESERAATPSAKAAASKPGASARGRRASLDTAQLSGLQMVKEAPVGKGGAGGGAGKVGLGEPEPGTGAGRGKR